MPPSTTDSEHLATLLLRSEQDVISSRQQARTIAAMLGFDRYDEVRVAVAVSEAARVALDTGTRGLIEFAVQFPQDVVTPQALLIKIAGLPARPAGLQVGRLMDRVETVQTETGPLLLLFKELYGRRLYRAELREMVATLPALEPVSVIDQLATYNSELITALEDATSRRREMQRINEELTETNRGVVALYDELDTMHRVSRVVASQIDLDSLLRAITEATTEVSGAEIGGFLTKVPDEDRFVCHSSQGPICQLVAETDVLQTADLLLAPDGGDILRIDDLELQSPTRGWPRPPIRSFLCVAVRDVEGMVIGALIFAHQQAGVFTERTERILASVSVQISIGMQNARLYRSVQVASAAKDQFLAMLSHELRTPLNPVFMLLASLDQNPDLSEEVRQDLQVMRRNLQLEARLIDDMLDLTRIVRGKVALHFETVDVHSLLPIVRDVCQDQITTQQAELELRLEAEQSWVVADSARLQQVFWNLLSNALKFSPKGRVVISTSNPVPGSLCVQVADNGRGINVEALTNIFRPFDQGDATTNTSYGGLGLGLAISNKVIDAHGGKIFAQSQGLGTGSTFTVELKLAEPPAAVATPGQPGPVAIVPTPAGARILLVEDHPDTLHTLHRLLKRRGFEVEPAQTAQVASALADNQPFDLVISDVGLPDRSGLDLMRELKEKHQLLGIALSGYGMDADIERSHSAGFVAHLTKPIDFAALEKAIAWVRASGRPSGDL